jgi:flavin-dependent dehydrogenase
MAFATESGMLAAKLALRQLNGETIDWQKEYSDYILYGVNVFTTYVKEWYTGNLQELFFISQKIRMSKEKSALSWRAMFGTRKSFCKIARFCDCQSCQLYQNRKTGTTIKKDRDMRSFLFFNK